MFGFWKLKRRAADNYDLMYQATKAEPAEFNFSPDNDEVWMAIVDRHGSMRYKNFTAGQ
jgi:hypothetical protein